MKILLIKKKKKQIKKLLLLSKKLSAKTIISLLKTSIKKFNIKKKQTKSLYNYWILPLQLFKTKTNNIVFILLK